MFFKTEKIWMPIWRAVTGLIAIYGLFYATAHLKLSKVMVFSYSSPIFTPLIAFLFLKEKTTQSRFVAAVIDLVGVICRQAGCMDVQSNVGDGMRCKRLDRQSLYHGLSTDSTESAEKIVFYFCFIGTHISNVLAVAAL